MCDPTLILAGNLFGTGLQAFGAIQSSRAAKSAGEFNAVTRRNQAADAITRGNKEVVRNRMRTRSLKGKQIAALAANGVALDEGSALDILASTDVLSDIDERTILDNADREAQGFRTQAELLQSAADRESPLLAGVTPLLTGGAQVASKWFNFSKVGAF